MSCHLCTLLSQVYNRAAQHDPGLEPCLSVDGYQLADGLSHMTGMHAPASLSRDGVFGELEQGERLVGR